MHVIALYKFTSDAELAMRAWPVTGVWSCFFFFSSRRRHTRLVSDWSSDVCSSDLNVPVGQILPVPYPHVAESSGDMRVGDWEYLSNGNIVIVNESRQNQDLIDRFGGKIGRASCRERV